MIKCKSDKEIQSMREGGKILAAILNRTAELIKPGVSADTLERFIEKEFSKLPNAEPSFYKYRPGFMKHKYPARLCVSVNEEVVHGLPSVNKIFQEGDLINIDCGLKKIFEGKELYLDAGRTIPCGKINEQSKKLLNATQEALKIAVSKCRIGNHIGDIGQAIQKFIDTQGFKIIKTMVGHGVGYYIHEDPFIPNFFPFNLRNPQDKGPEIREGMTLAIEPMISISAEHTTLGSDSYAAVTIDGSWSAQFEDTVAVTKQGPLILTQL